MIYNFAKQLKIDIPDSLEPFVASIIYANSKEKVSLSYPMYATGFPLLIHLAGDKPTIHVNGRIKDYNSNFNLAGQIYDAEIMMRFNNEVLEALGLVLFPTAPYYLFHSKASKFNNKWTAIEDFAQFENFDISEINITSEVNKRINIIFQLLKKLSKNRLEPLEWLDNSIGTILNTRGNINVKELSDSSNMSSRNFRRLFKDIIGMPPKYYCKVIQVNTVFHLQNARDNQSLLDIALDCGYFDHSHFIKDFKHFIGRSPNDFFNSDYSYISEYLGVR